MPAKIPKPTIPIDEQVTKNGFLNVFNETIEQNRENEQNSSNLIEEKTQKLTSSVSKQSKDIQKYLKDYLLAVAKTGCSSATIRNYKSDINQFLDFLGDYDLNDLRNKPKLLAFAHFQRDKNLKESSIKRKLVSITQFKIWLKDQGLINSEIPLSTFGQTNVKDDKNDELERNIIDQRSDKNTDKSNKDNTKQTQIPDHGNQRKDKKPRSRLLILLNILALLLFMSGLAYFAYQQFGQAIISMAYPSAPVAPSRILSYQGRLTNTAQSPISAPTAMSYSLYDADTGGSLLWSSNTCTIDPDQDGIFNANLGAGVGTGADNENCGGAIGDEVFTESANVWLQVTIGAETLTPRQPIRTVAYALNSSTLQGLPPAEIATNSTILMMNSAGEVVLGTNNPTIKAATTSSGMTIEANKITIKTYASSNGDIILAPDGTGIVDVQGSASVSGDTTLIGNVYISSPNNLIFGGTTALGEISAPNDSGAYLVGAYDEFVHSSSGNVQGVLNDLDAVLDDVINGITGVWTDSGALTYLTATGDNFAIGGNSLASPFSVDVANNTVRIGNGSATNAVLGMYASDGDTGSITYSTDDAFVFSGGNIGLGASSYINWGSTIGTAGYGIRDNAGVIQYKNSAGTWADVGSGTGGGDSFWNLASGAIFANNTTADLLIGGNSTASAKFAFTNVNSGIPTLSFANQASAIDLANSTVNALNIENGLMSFDTLNSRVGIGTGSSTPSALLALAAATTGRAQLNLASSSGTNPISLNNGDLWWNGTSLNFYNGTSTTDILAGSSLWTDAGTYIYPTAGETIGNSVTGGSNKVAGLYLADNGPLYFGNDNDTNFSFSGSTLATTLGSNVWNIGSDLLYLEGATNRIGIGTSSPLATLDIRALDTDIPVASISGATNLATLIVDQSGSGDIFTASASGATQFVITNDGNVGIGVADPTSRLQIAGATSSISNVSGDITLDAASGNISFSGDSITNINNGLFSGSIGIGTVTPDRRMEIIDASNPQLRLTQTDASIYTDFNMNSNGDLVMNVDGVTNQFVLDNGGNVGIGLTNPDEKLTVNGAINAEKYYDYTNKNYFLDPAAISTSLKTAGSAHIGGDVYVEGGEIFITPLTLSTSTTEGTVYYDDDVDHLYLYDGNSTWHRIALDMTKYSNNAVISNQDYIEIAHNQNSNDLTFTVWIKDAITNLWKKIDPTSSSVDHDLNNEFNPEFTQKKKVSAVSLQYEQDPLGTGADGAIVISTTTSINATNKITGRSCADGGDAVNYSISALTSTTATLTSSPSVGCLAVGDEVLIINLQGTPTAYANVGNWETLKVASVTTNTVTFASAKTKFYGNNVSDDTNLGVVTNTQRVMLQRVPNYTNVTVDAAAPYFTPTAYNGVKGGVMFFRASGTVNVNGYITATGTGYRGGAGAAIGYQGESTARENTTITSGVNPEGGAGGGNTSGGGQGCAGGGGGGYGTAGLIGTRSGSTCGAAGAGGTAYPTGGNATLTKLYMGSGGGGGSMGYSSGWNITGMNGGIGGGIVYIAANNLNVSGYIYANGNNGVVGTGGSGTIIPNGGGGGGAGGSIKIVGSTLSLGASKVTASGGIGGVTPTASSYAGTWSDLGGRSNGGNGGTGLIAVGFQNSSTGSTLPAATPIGLPYSPYAIYTSKEISTPATTAYNNISWTENLPSGTEVQVQTRSGATENATDGTWEVWKPSTLSTDYYDLASANTHTSWTGTNLTVAEGDVARNVDNFEDEDENNSGNLTKTTSTLANGYAETTIGAANISSYQYLTFWVRSAAIGQVVKFGFGETAATENEKTFYIDKANTWQKVYWDISGITGTARDAVTKLRLTNVTAGNVLHLDNVKAEKYLTTASGSTITSTPNKYLQYRFILSTTNTANTPSFSNVQVSLDNANGTQTIDVDSIIDPNAAVKNQSSRTIDPTFLEYAQYSLGTGADGAITISVDTSINATNKITGRSCADGGDAVNYSISALTSTTATLTSSPSVGCLAVGDEVLIINLQGTPTAYANVGNWETLKVASVTTNTVTFASAKTKFYGNNVSDDTNLGVVTNTQRVMLQRVPNYTNVTIDATRSLVPNPYNGIKGGVIFFRASGTVNANGYVNAAGYGYRGGAGVAVSPGYQGESTTRENTTQALAANPEGGAGGGSGNGAGTQGCSGGGGGGYGTAGAAGTFSGANCVTGGTAGTAYPGAGNATLTKLYMGSAGAGGSVGYNGSAWGVTGASGGAGGGIIYVAANTVNVSGGVIAYGANGGVGSNGSATAIPSGSGGGGAGGSIKIVGATLALGASKVNANGGTGGVTVTASSRGDAWSNLGGRANGGNGGTGLISTYYTTSTSGSATPAAVPDTAVGNYNAYKVLISKEISIPGATALGNISWTENIPSGTEVQLQTRSGNSTNSTDGTWEAWRPTASSVSIEDANTHTNWTGTNATVADGDVTRDVNYYEDEDEANAGNLTKYTATLANGYAETTIGAANLSSYQYVTLWVRSVNVGSVITLGMGEAAGTEQTKSIVINSSNVWQKVYWDISGITGTARDAVTKFRVTSNANGNVVYLDNVKAESNLTTNTGSTITSTANNYIQYRAILTTTSVLATPTLSEVSIAYTDGSGSQVAVDRIANQNNIDQYNQDSKLRITTIELDDSKSSNLLKLETGVKLNSLIDVGNGADGDVTISISTNINATNKIAGRSCSDGGDAVNYSVTDLTSRTATVVTSPSTGCLAIGDEVLLINLRGTASSQINTGNYETLRIESIDQNIITFTTSKTKYYGENATDDTDIGVGVGKQIVLLQRVPNYHDLIVNSGANFVPSVFDGAKGGVMFFRASGDASVNGTISTGARGYRGGVYAGDDAFNFQGESTAGYGVPGWASSIEGGGGGGYYHCGGGGGGGYKTAGEAGIKTSASCAGSVGSSGPAYPTYDNSRLEKLYFGSGGGAGSTGYDGSNWTDDGGAGGAGGGIIYIASNTITVSGLVSADGAGGTAGTNGSATVIPSGGGGGGAGGSVKIVGNKINMGPTKVTAYAGVGGTVPTATTRASWFDLGGYSSGGDGGIGIIATNYGSSVSGSSYPASSVAQVPANNYSVLISDEIPTPNATSYDKISWLADETPYGVVQVQTRSGATSNSTDGSWEAWKTASAGANFVSLQTANTHTDWLASDTTLTVADGDVSRNINYFEDEDEVNVGNTTKLTSTSNANTYAETVIGAENLSNYDFITFWVRSNSIGNTMKFSFGENTATEHETLVNIESASTWQKIYFDISHIPSNERDGIRNFRITSTTTSNVIYIDNIKAERLLSNSSGSTITSKPNEYLQYRVVLASSDPGYAPILYNVHATWNNGYKVEQTDSNTVRLYNYTGEAQDMRLDVIVFGADLAEWYTVEDESIGPADLVAITGEMDEYGVPILRKANQSNDKMLIGVISTQAGTELGIKADNRRLLALDGRVPVKIDPTSPVIEKGDHLTSSGQAGLARKAKTGELSIGRSFEAWTPESGKDRVMAIVNDTMATPSFGQQLVDGVVEIADLLNLKIQDSWDVVNYGTGETVKSAAALAQAIIGKLKVGQMEVSEIKAPEDGKLSLEGSNISFQLNDKEASGSSASALGKLIIQNKDGETVASFDSEGNASISGQLDVAGISRLGQLIASEASVSTIIAQTASISGELIANNIQADSARLDFIESKLANLENASVSGTLYANNIEAGSIHANAISGLEERLSSKIAETLNQPSLLASLFGDQTQQTEEYLNQLNQEINSSVATESANLNDIEQGGQDLTLIADSAYVNQYFEVNGSAFIANSLKIGQSLMVGESTIVGDGFISYQPEIAEGEDFNFSIQPAGIGKLSLMAGLMQLDGQGFVSINGDLKVAGVLEVADDLKVKGTLLTNLISADKPGENIRVQLASKDQLSESASDSASLDGSDLLVQKSNFEFINENQTPVATFSSNGDLALTGSLRLGQNLEIASESGELINSRSAGQAILEAGTNEVTIMSDKLEENSMIYITPMNSTNNQVLYVKNKITDSPFTPENEAQFTVAIDYVLGHNVTFNWWIIQLN